MKTSDVSVSAETGRRRVDVIAAQMRDDVISGRLVPGQRLASIDDLAMRFGASRAVVREALRGLSERGLVRICHGDGTYASAPKIEDVADVMSLLVHLSSTDRVSLLLSLMEARLILEPEASKLAAERATPGEIAELGRLVEKGIAAAERQAFDEAVEHDMQLHTAVARASHSPILAMILEVIAPLMREMRQAMMNVHKQRRMTLKAHRMIVKAIADRDGERARAEAIKHVEEVNGYLKTQLMGLGD